MVAAWERAPFTEPTERQIAGIIARHRLGIPPSEVARITSPGIINSVYGLGDRFVLRVPKRIDESLADAYTESVAVPVVHGAGVRTPALVAFDDSRDILDVPFTIYERVHGRCLALMGSDPEAFRPIYRELGRQLAVLHHGVEDCPDPEGRLDAHQWSDAEVVLTDAVEAGLLSPTAAGWIRPRLAALAPAIQGAGPWHRFVHGDLSPLNVLVDDAGLVHLIDWGDAGWGDPVTDVVGVPIRAVVEVLAGYREVGPFDGDVTAEARILFGHLCLAVESLHSGSDPHHVDWKRPPAARMVELLAAIRSEPWASLLP